MQELEEILKEIDAHAIEFETFGISDDYISVGWVKEIIRNHMNDGWIPVDRGLPEEGQEVWVAENTDCVRRGAYTEAFGFGMRKGFICSDGFMCIGNVLAWKPYMYPEPYRPERSEE